MPAIEVGAVILNAAELLSAPTFDFFLGFHNKFNPCVIAPPASTRGARRDRPIHWNRARGRTARRGGEA